MPQRDLACLDLSARHLPILVEAHLWSRLPESFHRNIEAVYVVLRKPPN